MQQSPKSQRTRSGPPPLVLRGELEGGSCAEVKYYPHTTLNLLKINNKLSLILGLFYFYQIQCKNLKINSNTVASARASSLPSPPSKEGGGRIEFALANALELWLL